ncbi:MAG TPA: DUF1592 domain-containing protein [Polyangiaceae bacterium]|nr:DUF1592 domain-containing protein [Polyangiaceae bacterium]
MSTGTDASTTGTGGATSGTAGSSTDGSTGGPPLPPGVCVPGVPVSSQISRLKNAHYDNIVRDILGVTTLASGALPSSLLNTDSMGAMNTFMWDAYQNAARTIAAEVMAGDNRANFIACDPAAANCLQDTIVGFGRKAFRRPLTEVEVNRFMALSTAAATATPPGTPEEVAQTMLEAFLLSPSFLQVNELNTTQEGTYFTLTSHEVATRLALMLWGTVPDADLNAAADANMLTTKEQILAQAERMLAMREKAGHQIGEVHRNYLALNDDAGHWFKERPDPAKYPLYKPEADVAMKAELDLFFEDVAYSGGSFKDIFLSNIGFVNEDTAPLYGIANVTGLEMTRVELDPTTRPGFLTRVGFLSTHAHSTMTSPILRGAYIIKNIIGSDKQLIPDEDALKTPPPPGEFATERAYVTELTNKEACRGCHHVYINPPGFVLEGFDAAGGVQTTDPRGGAIETTADVLFGDETKTISTPLQLMEEIVKGDFARRGYVEKVVAGATGRLPNANDACLVDELNTKLTMDGYTILDLFADITQADSFRLRNRAAN